MNHKRLHCVIQFELFTNSFSLFSYVLLFSPNTTTRRMMIRSEVDDLFTMYNIHSYQVFWLGETSNYVPESMEILGYYGAMVQVPPESVIFHDCENAFMSQGESVIPLIWGVKAATYPPIVHQFLSPNDNRFHGAAKEKWRSLSAEKGWGKEDSVESSLALLSFLSHYDPKEVSSYFRENFFLERKSIQPDRCMGLVTSGLLKKIRKSPHFDQAQAAYRRFIQEHQRTNASEMSSPPPCLEGTLDGKYWN